MTNDETISTLNDLTKTSKDGETGFSTCAAKVKDMQLKTVFTAAAQRCAEGAKELQEQVRLLGGIRTSTAVSPGPSIAPG